MKKLSDPNEELNIANLLAVFRLEMKKLREQLNKKGYSFPSLLYKRKRIKNTMHAEIREKRLIFTSIQYSQIKFIIVRKNK